MKSDPDDSDDDEKYHNRSVGSGHPVENVSNAVSMDADINDLVNNDLKADEPDAKISQVDESASINMDNNRMGFDRNDSDDGAMKFSEPYENGSYMYADGLKHCDDDSRRELHVQSQIPSSGKKKYPTRGCTSCLGHGIRRDINVGQNTQHCSRKFP